MNAISLVDRLVSRYVVMHVLEERLKGGGSCQTLVPRNLGRCERLAEERANSLDECVCAKEVPSSKLVPDGDSTVLSDELAILWERSHCLRSLRVVALRSPLSDSLGIREVGYQAVRMAGPSEAIYQVAKDLEGGRTIDIGEEDLLTGMATARDVVGVVSRGVAWHLPSYFPSGK